MAEVEWPAVVVRDTPPGYSTLSVDELERIAAQLVDRVRTDDPDDNAQWLATVCPHPHHWWELCFALASAVHADGKTWRELTRWTRVTASDAPAGMRRDVDEVAVERAMRGEQLTLTADEYIEAVERLAQRGLTPTEVGRVLGAKPRDISRLMAKAKAAA